MGVVITRGHREKGQALIESAFVLLPMMALVCGLIDFAMSSLVQSTLNHAVREGVRYGVTGRSDAEIKAIVKRYSMGFLGSENQHLIRIQYLNATTFQVEEGPGSNRSGNILEVRVNDYPWGWIYPMGRVSPRFAIRAESADIVEPLNAVPVNRE